MYKINDDGTVILVSTQATTAAMGLGGALGYNNSVYLLDKTCQELYSNNSIGAIARNIKIEDIENELNQNALNKINSYVSTGGSRIGEKRTFYEYYAFYPNLYKHEKGAGIDTTITNSTGVEKSDKYYNTPTTEGMTRAQSLTITQTSYNVPLEINDFKNDVTLELLRGPKYWISSRAVDDSTNGYAIFATLTFFPNRILPYSNMDSTNTTIAQNFSLKPLVTLKKDKIKKAMQLYLVTDRHWLKAHSLYEDVEAAINGGVTCVQLREKHLNHQLFVQEAKELKELCNQNQIPLIINDDVEVMLEVDADGIHVGQSDMQAQDVRKLIGSDKVLGVSVQTVEQAITAQNAGADYLGVGAVFPTGTKDDAIEVDLATLQDICQHVDIPIVAIGGINQENLLQLKGSGIDGIAVVSAIMAAEDIIEVTKQLKEKTKELLL